MLQMKAYLNPGSCIVIFRKYYMLIFRNCYILIFRKCYIQVSENTTCLFSNFAAYLFSGNTCNLFSFMLQETNIRKTMKMKNFVVFMALFVIVLKIVKIFINRIDINFIGIDTFFSNHTSRQRVITFI